MPHYGILRNHRFDDAEDVRGAEVYGVNDEKLGKIDDVIFDHTSGDIRYAVVDTGGWLSSKKFLVPINRISPYGNHDDKFYAELDKERIQMLPEYSDRPAEIRDRLVRLREKIRRALEHHRRRDAQHRDRTHHYPTHRRPDW